MLKRLLPNPMINDFKSQYYRQYASISRNRFVLYSLGGYII